MKKRLLSVFLLTILALLFLWGGSIIYLQSNRSDALTNLNEKSRKTNDSMVHKAQRNFDGRTKELLIKKERARLEKFARELAQRISLFLEERQRDILTLAEIKPNDGTYEDFLKAHLAKVFTHYHFSYNESSGSWEGTTFESQRPINSENLAKSFPLPQRVRKNLYKEITYYDLKGNEVNKFSRIKSKKINVKQKRDTFLGMEDYFYDTYDLRSGDVFMSKQIGKYTPSSFKGNVSHLEAQKKGVTYRPTVEAYAGLENPYGRKYEGIIRIITPYFAKGRKQGFLTLALDTAHLRSIVDYIDPLTENHLKSIPFAGAENFAFVMAKDGELITHPRNQLIAGGEIKPKVYQDHIQHWKEIQSYGGSGSLHIQKDGKNYISAAAAINFKDFGSVIIHQNINHLIAQSHSLQLPLRENLRDIQVKDNMMFIKQSIADSREFWVLLVLCLVATFVIFFTAYRLVLKLQEEEEDKLTRIKKAIAQTHQNNLDEQVIYKEDDEFKEIFQEINEMRERLSEEKPVDNFNIPIKELENPRPDAH
jgi:hypothetical protein